MIDFNFPMYTFACTVTKTTKPVLTCVHAVEQNPGKIGLGMTTSSGVLTIP